MFLAQLGKNASGTTSPARTIRVDQKMESITFTWVKKKANSPIQMPIKRTKTAAVAMETMKRSAWGKLIGKKFRPMKSETRTETTRAIMVEMLCQLNSLKNSLQKRETGLTKS